MAIAPRSESFSGNDEKFSSFLKTRRLQGLYRTRVVLDAAEAPKGHLREMDGRLVVVFCDNDYLGLATHPQVIEALTRAAHSYGVGSGASQLVSGYHREHRLLEEALAEYLGFARVLLFSSGYLANLGVISALANRGDDVVEDRLDHASLIDGARLAGARLKRFQHADPTAAGALLSERCAVLATDTVFSMDGDLAPLPALAKLPRSLSTCFVVDDAHGLGVLGRGGRGALDHFGMKASDVDGYVATLGKSLGTCGAFVAGSDAFVETMIQKARSAIYSTALPPAIAAAARAALGVMQSDSWRLDKLHQLIRRFRRGASEIGLPVAESHAPIQPLIVGDERSTVALSCALLESGFLVTAIRPPTVPRGGSRLRIALSADHEESQVDALLEALECALQRLPRDDTEAL